MSEIEEIKSTCEARLASLAAAVQGWTTEAGTTSEEDLLLFQAGFRDTIPATTPNGSSVRVSREEGGLLSCRMSVDTYGAECQIAGDAVQTLTISGLGLVAVKAPSADELLKDEIETEMQSNLLSHLPEWAREAVIDRYKSRKLGKHGGTTAERMKRAKELNSEIDELTEAADDLQDEGTDMGYRTNGIVGMDTAYFPDSVQPQIRKAASGILHHRIETLKIEFNRL